MIIRKPKICFHARHYDFKAFELFDYYSNDIKIFRELGYEVVLSRNTKTIPSDCDLYFIWWWTSGIIALLKAKYLKKPTIMIGNLHYDDPSDQGYFQRPFYIKSFIKYCLRHSDLQIATAKIEYDGIIKLNASNPHLIYHCIDTDRYTFSKKETRQNFILTLTQLTKENVKRKKVKEIIQAFSLISDKIPEYQLLIAGRKEDSGYPALKILVDSLNLSSRVKFLGRVSDSEKIRLYQTCKLYVQPSSFEGFGMAIAENMSCGTPVIASDKGAVREVADDLIIYVDPDNIEEIGNSIVNLLNDKDLYDKLHTQSRKRIVDNFSIHKRKESIKVIIEQFFS